MNSEINTDVVIVGAGSAGLYALREVRRARKSFILIDTGPLGTTCARVGCMPSKVALHAAKLWAGCNKLSQIGVTGTDVLSIDLSATWSALRAQRDKFSHSAATKARNAAGEHLIIGAARFLEPTLIEVDSINGKQTIRASSVVIATGSRPVVPAWLEPVKNRMVTTDDFFELSALPERVGILGLGAIGLEMGAALSRLGVEVIGADLASTVAGITDPVIAKQATAHFGSEMTLWLGAPVSVERTEKGVLVRSGDNQAEVDLILSALGRRPNVDMLGLAEAGFPIGERGMPVFDTRTLQIGHLPVFIAGDANGFRPLMHEAADEGAIAGFNAVQETVTRFRRKVAVGIAFTDPDICSVGARFDELHLEHVVIGSASGEANGRAKILGAESSLLRVYADARDGQLLGASILADGGEHLAHLLAWAIQRGETATSLLELPFYHPVMEEMLQTALQEIAKKVTMPGGVPLGLVADEFS